MGCCPVLLRNVNISCFQFLGSIWAVLMALPRVLINLSASPLAFGHNGVILWCLNPNFSANCLYSKLWNGGPLSVFSSSGIPNNEKILSNRGITDLADVDRSTSTTGYLEWSSITTNRYSPVGNGPQKSAETRDQGSSGISVICSGS